MRLNSVGHIQLGSEEELYLTIAPANWAEVQGVPERRSVLAVVQQVDLDVPTLGHCGADRGYGFSRRIRPLQEAAVATQNFVPVITSQSLKRLVGEHNGVVGTAGVGDDHRHTGAANSRRERIAATKLMRHFIGQAPIVLLLHLWEPG